MDFPCNNCKHEKICSRDEDYECSALFVFHQLNKNSLEERPIQITLGIASNEAYDKNLQYVKQQYIKK